MHQLKLVNELFTLGHDLVRNFPDWGLSWYAVGTYYYAQGKSHEARRYFRYFLLRI
jgi:hypothetical protein